MCCLLCELRESVLALECQKVIGLGGGEGRVLSLMAAAIKREVSNCYYFFFVFDVSLMNGAPKTAESKFFYYPPAHFARG